MRKIIFGLLLVLAGLIFVVPARAQEDTLQVLAVQTMRKGTPLPKVMTGKDISVKQPVNQDMLIFSGNVDVESQIDGNLAVAGGDIKVNGLVKENLVVAGGNITVGANVAKNVIVMGGNVILSEGARVNGYLVVFGGQIDMEGKVDGDVRLAGGDVKVGNKSVLGGKLVVDGNKVDVSNQAVVTGEKQIKIIESKADQKSMQAKLSEFKKAAVGAWIFGSVVWFVGEAVLLLVLVRLFGKNIKKTTKLVTESFWNILGWGFIKLFLAPFAIMILLMTVIGAPLAILVTAVYVMAIFMAKFIVAAVLGHYLTIRGWLKTDNLYIQAVLGLLIIALVGLVPFVGWIFKFGVVLTGLGVVITWEKGLLKEGK